MDGMRIQDLATVGVKTGKNLRLRAFLYSCIAISLLLISGTPAFSAPIYFEEVESWEPDTTTRQTLERSHAKIQEETGLNVCFILGLYNYQNKEQYQALDEGRCDGFLFMLQDRMEYQSRDLDYEHISMGYDASEDAWPSHYELSELDFVPGPRPENLQSRRIEAFAERLIQKTNHPAIYWIREIYEEATEEYVLQILINYCISMALGLVPVGLYLLYRSFTRNLGIGWKWHFLVAVLLPLILLFIYLPVLNSFHEPMKSNAYPMFPILGLGYAFCAFVATFFLGQRITGVAEWPPYWAIFLIYLLAPLALFAAGAAKGAIGSAASGGGSGGSGKGSGDSFKGSGGTFGGGGASGGW